MSTALRILVTLGVAATLLIILLGPRWRGAFYRSWLRPRLVAFSFVLVDMVVGLYIYRVLIAVSSGYRRGFWLSLAQYVGLVFGVLVGAALARFIMDLFRVSGGPSRSLGAIIVLIVFGTVGSTIGFWLGEPIRIRLVARPGRGRADSVGGAIFSGLAVLTVSWFLGLAFDRIPNPGLAQAIQHSAILL